MENLFITLTLLITTLSYSQINLTVKSDDMHNISNKEITTEVYGNIIIEEGAELFINNTIIKAERLEVFNKGGIHLSNSIILWTKRSNMAGDLVSKKLLKNRQVKDMFSANGLEVSIRVNGNVIYEGIYESVMNNYIPQGIYDIYIEGNLIDIIYFL